MNLLYIDHVGARMLESSKIQSHIFLACQKINIRTFNQPLFISPFPFEVKSESFIYAVERLIRGLF